MADQQEPKARYPKVDPEGLPKGAKHGYIGAVEVYDPATPGHSNVEVGKAGAGDGNAVSGTIGIVRSDDATDLGAGGTIDNVKAPKH